MNRESSGFSCEECQVSRPIYWATDEDGDTLAEYDAKQFYAFAWVENEDIPELSEYGTVIIERCNGGLWRVC